MILSRLGLGLVVSRIVAAASGSVGNSGDNYLFDGTSLLLKNSDESRWFKWFIVGTAGNEQIEIGPEVVSPVPAAPPVTGDNYQFALTDIFRLKHSSLAQYHRLDYVGGGLGVLEVSAGAASNPAAAIALSGINYRFSNFQFQIKDTTDGLYYAPILVGPVATQQLSYL